MAVYFCSLPQKPITTAQSWENVRQSPVEGYFTRHLTSSSQKYVGYHRHNHAFLVCFILSCTAVLNPRDPGSSN